MGHSVGRGSPTFTSGEFLERHLENSPEFGILKKSVHDLVSLVAFHAILDQIASRFLEEATLSADIASELFHPGTVGLGM